jgi:hypothetical protein
MIELKFAETHGPVFLTAGDKGYNLKNKLNVKERKGLKLQYDAETELMHVEYNGFKALVPSTNIVVMIPWDSEMSAPKTPDEPERVSADAVRDAQRADTPTGAPPTLKQGIKQSIDAQVSTPTDHVFAGPGKGKTRS